MRFCESLLDVVYPRQVLPLSVLRERPPSFLFGIVRDEPVGNAFGLDEVVKAIVCLTLPVKRPESTESFPVCRHLSTGVSPDALVCEEQGV